MSLRIALLGASIWLACTHAFAQTAGEPAHDVLCKTAPAGAVQPVPDIAKDLAVVLCTPKGQALAVAVDREVVLWVRHGTAESFMLFALPEHVAAQLKFLPSEGYKFGFLKFAAREMTGAGRDLTLEMWKRGFDATSLPDNIGKIVQLDALSVYEHTVFNLFFYFREDKPRWPIVCRDRCNLSVSIDILRGEELDARVQRRLRHRPDDDPVGQQRDEPAEHADLPGSPTE